MDKKDEKEIGSGEKLNKDVEGDVENDSNNENKNIFELDLTSHSCNKKNLLLQCRTVDKNDQNEPSIKTDTSESKEEGLVNQLNFIEQVPKKQYSYTPNQ